MLSVQDASGSPMAQQDSHPMGDVPTLACGFTDNRTGFSGQLSLAMTTAALEHLEGTQQHFLSAHERQELATMKVNRRRTSFLRGRAAAKAALCKGFDGAPTRWSVRSGVFGQPVAAYQGGEKCPVLVSISHSERAGIALAAPAEWPAALDLEAISPKNRTALESQLTESERRWCHAADNPLAAATALWSLKEAASKVLGGGLALDFRALEAQPQGGGTGVTCRFTNIGHLSGEAVIGDSHVFALVCSSHSQLTEAAFLIRALHMLEQSLPPAPGSEEAWS